MKRLAFACVICILVAGVTWWKWSSRNGIVSSNVAEPSAASISVATPEANPQPSRSPSRSSSALVDASAMQVNSASPSKQLEVSLPPVGTRVADVVAQLSAAADQGEPHASCRVGIELERCAAAYRDRTWRANQPSPEVIASGFTSPAEKQAFLTGQHAAAAALSAKIALCDGINPDEASKAPNYLWSAANSGSVAAMSKYARDPPIDTQRVAEFSDEIARYKNDAPRFLAGAIRGGDVMALYVAWAGAMSGMSMLGAGVFERNPYNALAYATALQTLVSGQRLQQVASSLQELRDELGPDKAADAEAEGMRIRAQDFAAPISPASDEDDGAIDATDCQR